MARGKPGERSPAPRSRHQEFRKAIELAEADGADRAETLLLLTQRDVADLKRDGAIALEDISFAGGSMRYLGVAVTAGGVAASALKTTGDAEPVTIVGR